MAMNGPFHFSFGFPGAHGVQTKSFPVSVHGVKGVKANSIVLGSATERTSTGDGHMGTASIEVLNLTPKNNGEIDVRINILWNSNLIVLVNLMIWTIDG